MFLCKIAKLNQIYILSLFLLLIQGCSQTITLGSAHYEQGNIYLEERSYIKAIQSFQLAIQENNKEAVYFLNLGFAQQKLLLYDHAVKSYLQAIKIKDTLPEAWYNLSIIYNDMDNIAQSEYAFKKFKALQK